MHNKKGEGNVAERIALKNTAPQERRAEKPRFQTEEECRRHNKMIAQRRFLSLIKKNALESGIPLSLLKVILQGSNDWFII